jgi:hypothetical protein
MLQFRLGVSLYQLWNSSSILTFFSFFSLKVCFLVSFESGTLTDNILFLNDYNKIFLDETKIHWVLFFPSVKD